MSAAEPAGISKTHFLFTAAVNPPWLVNFINQHLARNNKTIMQDKVKVAIAKLASSGTRVSKSAVRKYVGVSESRAVDALFFRRNHTRPDELLLLLKKFERHLAKAPEVRD